MTDWVTAALVIVAASISLLNIRRALDDRSIKGSHWAPTAYFTALGVWQVYFLADLGQVASAAANVVVVAVNASWLMLFWRFTRSEAAPGQ